MNIRNQAVKLLRANGYQELENVLSIASASFKFDFVLWSSHFGFNLVVGAVPRSDLPRRVAALARALDYLGSKASITLVIEADALDPRMRAEVSRFARVLLVRAETLEDDLRVLLPLHLELRAVSSLDPMAMLRRSNFDDLLISEGSLLKGYSSEQRVRDSLRDFVAEELIEK